MVDHPGTRRPAPGAARRGQPAPAGPQLRPHGGNAARLRSRRAHWDSCSTGRATPGWPTPLPGWEQLAAAPPVVFVGGPVQHQAVICLARAAGPRRPLGAAGRLERGPPGGRHPRPRSRPGGVATGLQPGSDLRRLRRMDPGPAGVGDHAPGPGGSWTRWPTTPSPTSRKRSGSGCSGARAARWRWWPPTRTTPATTEVAPARRAGRPLAFRFSGAGWPPAAGRARPRRGSLCGAAPRPGSPPRTRPRG